ncbi:MAG: hypothetical protein A2622_01905 [Bdellovibrionales bacterium RIFCSPHIGHO2_01_FULL_40_29]|nr:MAG: hypothetical protein A2622_01905 [Bdellovibrionales bacterium RIFCSPHIGHO2_01_FULL_40_29]OFZ33845.1 MAG: hypothetical protein A3D17_02325 [Bdellovibrionales bacterium RIFCSPHIGHO2_02_FULL_40_15]
MKKIITASVLALTTITLFSCQKSSTEDLKDAQICLNNSTPSTARDCMTAIAGDTSAAAYKLRCSAVFISEGFNTPASFMTALDSLNGTGTCTGGCSSTVTAVTSLSFSSGDNTQPAVQAQNLAVSAEALSYCSLAETSIYQQISSLFRIGTLASMKAYELAGVAGAEPTPDEIKAAIAALPVADLGEIAIATHAASCQDVENASDSTKQYCAELASALGSGTGSAADVGTCFQGKLLDPDFVCAP